MTGVERCSAILYVPGRYEAPLALLARERGVLNCRPAGQF